MGIREFFRENPPGEKDLNIHDIAIEDREKYEELPFDFIMPEDQIRIDTVLNNLESKVLTEERERVDFCLLKIARGIIFDQKIQWNELGEQVEHWLDIYASPEPFVDSWSQESIIPPSDPDAVEVLHLLTGDNPSAEFDKKGKRILFEDVSRLLSDAMSPQFPEIADHISKVAMQLKLLFREKSEEFNDRLDKTTWDEMKNDLHEIRKQIAYSEKFAHSVGHNDKVINFSRLAMRMAVLAAEAIKITDQGIEIVILQKRKKDFRVKKTPRPERRRF